MTISKDLMLSVLAMDAYNRGEGAAINLTGAKIGNVSIGRNSDTLLDEKSSSDAEETLAQDVGFFAIEYTVDSDIGLDGDVLEAGRTIVSYRGTDQLADVIHGWGIGVGFYWSDQFKYSTDFLEEISRQNDVVNKAFAQDVLLTGHSLGGGLAGLNSRLYGQEAVLFDPMGYYDATNLLAIDYNSWDLLSRAQARDIYSQELSFLTEQQLENQGVPLTDIVTGYYLPGSALNYVNQGSIALAHEDPLSVLEAVGEDEADGLFNLSHTPGVDETAKLHGAAGITLQMFADEWQDPRFGLASSKLWLPIHEQVFQAWFSGDIAEAIEPESLILFNSSFGGATVRTMLAYSVLDEGELPFGNVGARAMFNDANELGHLVERGLVTDGLTASLGAITKVFVQFAATMALRGVERDLTPDDPPSGDPPLDLGPDPLEGVLTGVHADEPGATDQLLTLNFSEDLWSIGKQLNDRDAEIIGVNNIVGSLVEEELSSYGIQSPLSLAYIGFLHGAAKQLYDIEEPSSQDAPDWSLANHVAKIEYALTDDARQHQASALPEDWVGPRTISMHISGGGDDTLKGSNGRDFIFAGKGNDLLYGKEGSDILLGGHGSDRIVDHFFLDGSDNTDASLDNDIYLGDVSNIFTSIADSSTLGGDVDVVEYSARINYDSSSSHAPQGVKVSSVKFTAFDSVLASVKGISLDVTDQNSQDTGTDTLVGIERIELSARADFAEIGDDTLLSTDEIDQSYDRYDLLIDGGDAIGSAQRDVLDFSSAGSAVYLARTTMPNGENEESVELYAEYIEPTGLSSAIFNVIRLEGTAGGFEGGSELRFRNFEKVTGSDYDDYLVLGALGAGGGPTSAEKSQIETIKSAPGSAISEDPSSLGVEYRARLEEARLLSANQVQVEIDGGLGEDVIHGTETGVNVIRGGAGDDVLRAGGFESYVYGGAGNDLISGNGMASYLYGGDGVGQADELDVFSLTGNTQVMDATAADHSMWDGVFSISGGVKQWWNEGDWAYWSPFTSIVSGLPGAFTSLFAVAAVRMDVATLGTFRFGISESNELITQFAHGRGGQALIHNYSYDYQTGSATGNVRVIEQDIVSTREASVDDFKLYITNALAAGYGTIFTGTDPLALDLDGDGLELSTVAREDVYFDLDADGFAERTAWVLSDDGFLAYDRNGNGVIDDITELFGDDTRSGFEALAELDSNADGIIDALDDEFSALSVWRDLDRDGQTDAGELSSLAETGIASINLASTESGDIERGSVIDATGSFTRTDGTTGTVADLTLDSSQTDTKWLGDQTVSAEAALLPSLRGYGEVKDLRVAMTDDPVLLQLVDTLANGVDLYWDDVQSAATDILFRWTGVDGVASVSLTPNFDQQKLVALEKFFGREMTPRNDLGVPDATNVDTLIAAWDDVVEKAAIRLAIQGPWSDILPGIGFDYDIDAPVMGSVDALSDTYKTVISYLSADASAASTEWASTWAPPLGALARSLIRHDGYEVHDDFAAASLVRALDQLAAQGAAPSIGLDTLVAGLSFKTALVGDDSANTLSRGSAEGLHIYLGGEGDDVLEGGDGQDVYVFGRNFGSDTIIDGDSGGREMGDRIRFAVHTSDEIEIKRDGLDLIFSVIGTDDEIKVVGHFSAIVIAGQIILSKNKSIEEIQFADGRVIGASEIAAAVGLGTEQSETLVGTALADEIEGLQGDDRLEGGDSGDLYYFGAGYGHDTIFDSRQQASVYGADTLLILNDLSRERASFIREQDNLVIDFGGGDKVTVEDQFSYGSIMPETRYELDNRIEAVIFARGGSLGWRDIQAEIIGGETTADDDTLIGFGTADEFFASAGSDYMSGLDGGDTYHFGYGSGTDVIEDASRYTDISVTDVLGNNWLAPDTLVLGRGITIDDVSFSRGAGYDLLIELANSTDSLLIKGEFQGQHADLVGLVPDLWFDRIESFAFADGTELSWQDVLVKTLEGTDGDDELRGALYGDVLDGGLGNDFLSGLDGSDLYIYSEGYGADVVHDASESVLGNPHDVVQFNGSISWESLQLQRSGDDLVFSLSGSDTLTVKDQFAVNYTGVFGTQWFSRIEEFTFSDGRVFDSNAVMQRLMDEASTDGNDTIVGFARVDMLHGGLGDDVLIGGDEADVYVFGRNEGSDIVRDSAQSIFADGGDRVELSNILSSQITVSRSQDDAIITLDTGATLTLEGQFAYSNASFSSNLIEQIHFDGGEIWTTADLMDAYSAQAKTSGDDQIEGFWRDDVIDGGLGNDLLRGGDGSDTYIYRSGDGTDIIEEEVTYISYDDEDELHLLDILPSEVSVSRINGDDLKIDILGTGESITIVDQFSYSNVGRAKNDIEIVKFSDGTMWTKADLEGSLLAATEADDIIEGFNTNDVLEGLGGDDILRGGDGSDTYRWSQGDGNDQIEEAVISTFYEDEDVLQFGDVNRSDVVFDRSGNDLLITHAASAETITVKDNFSYSSLGHTLSDIERIVFADGETLSAEGIREALLAGGSGSDELVGFQSDDLLDGGEGDDILKGGDGSDTYVYRSGDGNDRIEESVLSIFYEEEDTLHFVDLNQDDVTFDRSGQNLVILDKTAGEQITVADHFQYSALGSTYRDIERFKFSDGTELSKDDVQRILLEGSDGDDLLLGDDQDNLIEGGKGNDRLEGGDGSDTYVFSTGDGVDEISDNVVSIFYSDEDQIILKDIDSASLQFGRSGNDLLIMSDQSFQTIAGIDFEAPTAEYIRVVNQFSDLSGIEKVQANDGLIFDHATIESLAILEYGVRLVGTDGADTLMGTDLADVFESREGDDILSGKLGSDIYFYKAGSGNDTIIEDQQGSEDNDVLRFADLDASELSFGRHEDNWIVTVNATSETINVADQFGAGSDAIERVVFADGTAWDAEDIRSNISVWYDSLSGSPGNDSISGTGDDETLVGGLGDDTLRGKRGSDSYVYNIGDGDDWIDEKYGNGEVDRLVFGVGLQASDAIVTRYTYDDDDVILSFAGHAGSITLNEQFSSNSSNYDYAIEEIVFGDGVTWNKADLQNAYLEQAATDSDDVIAGFDGADDTLRGGLGDDTLEGLRGSDSYVYNIGDGDDWIDEGYGNGEVDRLVFGVGLQASDAIVTRSIYDSDDAILSFAGHTGSITLNEQFSSNSSNYDYAIEEIVFDDGTIWNKSDIEYREQNPVWIGVDDSYSVASGETHTLDLLANDVIPNGASAEYYIWTQPSHGTVTWNGTSYVYQSDPGFVGVDSFEYGLHEAVSGQAMVSSGIDVSLDVYTPDNVV